MWFIVSKLERFLGKLKLGACINEWTDLLLNRNTESTSDIFYIFVIVTKRNYAINTSHVSQSRAYASSKTEPVLSAWNMQYKREALGNLARDV